QSPYFVTPTAPPQLDIVFWAVKSGTIADSSALAQHIFDEAARLDLHLALASLPIRLFPPDTWSQAEQNKTVTCLRSVLMKPEHLPWLDQIWQRLEAATRQAAMSIPH
ncbi:MAG TPA: hypothetical protein VK608_11500, partial [Edaphobacter sp.]|nr:hypothetical protein [Edaphobacter sp.]